MNTIIQNALKCRHCGEIVESTHRHHFAGHFCAVKPRFGRKWVGEGIDAFLVETGEITYNFAADGGQAYLRRIGNLEDCEEVSKYWPGFDGSHLDLYETHLGLARGELFRASRP